MTPAGSVELASRRKRDMGLNIVCLIHHSASDGSCIKKGATESDPGAPSIVNVGGAIGLLKGNGLDEGLHGYNIGAVLHDQSR